MSTLTFADTHNMVAFLEKPTESDGFHEIIDFLNANQIRYALTVNPTIYTSCIEQSDLHLEDAGGTDCLPTATIFEELARMGYEKPSQKLTFYKAFFSPQWKFLIHTINPMISAIPLHERISIVITAATTTTTTRPKARGVVVQEPNEFRTSPEVQSSKSKDKGKEIIIEPEVPLKRKDQVSIDEDLARNIQAHLDAEIIEEERLERKKQEEANIAWIESWENT
ncbi:hypothetical protein Tco_0718838 [Tanacetum coccineum]